MSNYRAGGACPIEGCSFEFIIECPDLNELDIVGQALMQAHSDHSHEGVPVNLYALPTSDDEERPRRLN